MFQKKYCQKNRKSADIELAKHFTIVVDNEVYVGVNDYAYGLTTIPKELFSGVNPTYDPNPRWGGDDYFYLGFMPLTSRYEGRLLNRLTSVTIVKNNNFYHLAPKTTECWLLLEKNLIQIHDILIATAPGTPMFPLGYVKPDAPSTHGYLKKHRTHSAALGAAHSSRYAFNVLMAALSFAIMLHHPEKENSDDNPSWAQSLEKNGVHAEYIQLLKESHIADFSIERIGTIISWKSKWLHFLERMEVANVPFWIHFGEFRTNQDPYAYCTGGQHARRYTPSPREVNALRPSSIATTPLQTEQQGTSFSIPTPAVAASSSTRDTTAMASCATGPSYTADPSSGGHWGAEIPPSDGPGAEGASGWGQTTGWGASTWDLSGAEVTSGGRNWGASTSSSGWGASASSSGWGESTSASGWGQSGWGQSGWGQSTASSGWGESTSASGWGQSGWGQSTASSGWGESTSTSGWGESTASSGWGNWGAITPSDRPAAEGMSMSNWGKPSPSRTTALPPQAAPPSQPAADQRPRPHKESRQRPGETWQEFFAREEKSQARRLANASPKELQQWASQERNAASHNIPGKKGPRVFVWEEHDEYPGFLYRNPVTRDCVEDVWGSYSKTTRRFNKFRNEWDLCKAWDPEARSDSDIDDEHMYGPYGEVYGPAPPSPPASSAPSVTTSPHPTNFIRDLETSFDNNDEPTTVPSSPLEIMLRNYFGFLWDNVPCPDTPVISWEKATAFLLHHNADISSEDLRNAICHFVSCRVNKQAAPPWLWDLNVYCEKPLHEHYDGRISVQAVKHNNQQTSYVLRTVPVSSDCPWLLVLQNAAAVLECLRCRWNSGDLSPLDIAKHLYQRGMAFSARLSISPPPNTQNKDGAVEALGWRRHDHQFTSIDYNSYLSRRAEFFNKPYTRAALEMEGIVGRLARESIGQDIALLGPVLEDGHVQSLFVDGGELWGDMLSDEDLDFICGVYKVEQASGTLHLTLLPIHFLTTLNKGVGTILRIPHFTQSIQSGLGVV
jgi:hypothetical protein